jgi:GNAT superfamily N-acetyltransferase
MQDEEIQAATASEPLTLAEEHAMQQSWRQDADKLTFITGVPNHDLPNNQAIRGGEGYAAIGDINLFITTDFDDRTGRDALVGELELMVAKKDMQGQGLGRAALLLFLQYVIAKEGGILAEYQGPRGGGARRGGKQHFDYLRVKIGKDNWRSLRLFRGLGFSQVGGVSYFGEIELRCKMGEGEVEEMMRKAGIEGGREVRYEDVD